MHDERRNRDYSRGPVWDETSSRWRVEIRYPDGSRVRKRLRREREALRLWAAAHIKIENGTWDDRAARNVTVAEALRQYREYSKVQHRSHKSYIGPPLTLWETHLGPQTHLAKVGSQQIEEFKLMRAQKVSHSTTDKDLAILKAFFNWCIAHRLAASNPVRRVNLFHDDNSRLRYLTREEYDRLIEAVRTLKARANRPSPYLEEKIVLAAHTGLRRGSLFNLLWEQIDFANSVMRIPRTKSGRPLSVPLNVTAKSTLERLFAERQPDNPYVFPHRLGKNAGAPVHDVKNGFRAALTLAGIDGFTWHDLRQHAGSRIMPGPAWEGCLSGLSRSIWRLPSRHNPAVFSSAALEPGMEETCWISTSKVATPFGAYDREFLARILTRSRRISPGAGTPPRRRARS